MQLVHYKVTNTTKQVGAKNGRHKLGFFVDVTKGKPIRPGEHITVEKVTPGILAMQRKGYIKVEAVKDINVEVKKQIEEINKEHEAQEKIAKAQVDADADTSKAKADADANKLKAEAHESKTTQVVSGLDKEQMKDDVRKGRASVTNATVSGENVDPLGDLESAEYLDGEPNFVVKAGKKKKGRKK